MATIRTPPIQLQTDGYIHVCEGNEEAGDFRVRAIGTDVAYCQLVHAEINTLPVKLDRGEMNVADLYKRECAIGEKQCRTVLLTIGERSKFKYDIT